MLANLLAEGGKNYTSLIFMGILVLLIVVFFVMSSRSNKKKKAETEAMMAKFRKGCHVKTIGGIMGKVVAINDADGTFILETGSNKQKFLIKFDKQAIYQVSEGKKVAPKKDEEDLFTEDEEETTPIEVTDTAEVQEQADGGDAE